VALNDILEIIPCTWDESQDGLNILTYQVTAVTGLGASSAVIAESADVRFATLYKQLIANTAQYLGVRCQKIWPLPVTPTGVGTANAGVGTGGDVCTPTGCAGLLSKATAAAGRSYRGRTYIPFVPVDAVVSDGLPTAAYLALLASLAVLMEGTFTAGAGANTVTLTPVLWSRKLHVATPLLTVTVSQAFATQRKRSAFGRPNIRPI
jgi:hypothetical protein